MSELMARAGAMFAAAAIMAALGGCSSSGDAAAEVNAASIVTYTGSERQRVVLTGEAAERIDVQTAPVEGAGVRLRIPYAAVLYEPNGATFAYANPEPLVFERVPITVDRIDGDRAVLASGPPAGTKVVTVGGVQLYGVELGVGDD